MPININDLKNKFGAEKLTNQANGSESNFLHQRYQIEEEMPELLSIEEFLNHLELFKKYGLEEIMLERVEHDIWYKCHYRPKEIKESEFYKQFKNNRIVQKHDRYEFSRTG